MVSDAAARGVEVIVYTGLTVSSDPEGRGAVALQRRLTSAGARVHVTTRVHAKTLAVDDVLAIEGSFNWFSASRDPQFARKDSSVALRGSDAAAAVAQIEVEFASLQAAPLPAEAAAPLSYRLPMTGKVALGRPVSCLGSRSHNTQSSTAHHTRFVAALASPFISSLRVRVARTYAAALNEKSFDTAAIWGPVAFIVEEPTRR